MSVRGSTALGWGIADQASSLSDDSRVEVRESGARVLVPLVDGTHVVVGVVKVDQLGSQGSALVRDEAVRPGCEVTRSDGPGEQPTSHDPQGFLLACSAPFPVVGQREFRERGFEPAAQFVAFVASGRRDAGEDPERRGVQASEQARAGGVDYVCGAGSADRSDRGSVGQVLACSLGVHPFIVGGQVSKVIRILTVFDRARLRIHGGYCGDPRGASGAKRQVSGRMRVGIIGTL